VGLDCEWNVDFSVGPGKVATLQLVWNDDRAVLLHLTKIFRSGSGPTLKTLMKEFFEHPRIQKIGRNVTGDIGRMCRDYSISAIPTKLLELGAFARARGIVDDGRAGLSVIVKNCLRKELPKSYLVRFSNWEGTLSEAQKKYAILDAYAGLKVYEKAINVPDTEMPLRPQDCRLGLQVVFCPGGHSVAIGRILRLLRKKVVIQVDEVVMTAYRDVSVGCEKEVVTTLLRRLPVQWGNPGIVFISSLSCDHLWITNP
jgi:hypothetical protein